MTLKVQCDSQTLIKILQGESDQITLELRNSIVQAFSKQYLKGIIDNRLEQDLKRSIAGYINKNVGIIDTIIENIVANEVRDIIYKKVEEEKIELEKTINIHVKETMDSKVATVDLNRIQHEINQIAKARMGL